MSDLGQQRALTVAGLMSASEGKADIVAEVADVCF